MILEPSASRDITGVNPTREAFILHQLGNALCYHHDNHNVEHVLMGILQQLTPALHQAIHQVHHPSNSSCTCTCTSPQCPLTATPCSTACRSLLPFEDWKHAVYKHLTPEQVFVMQRFAQPTLIEAYHTLSIRFTWQADQLQSRVEKQQAQNQSFTGMCDPDVVRTWIAHLDHQLLHKKATHQKAMQWVAKSTHAQYQMLLSQWRREIHAIRHSSLR